MPTTNNHPNREEFTIADDRNFLCQLSVERHGNYWAPGHWLALRSYCLSSFYVAPNRFRAMYHSRGAALQAARDEAAAFFRNRFTFMDEDRIDLLVKIGPTKSLDPEKIPTF